MQGLYGSKRRDTESNSWVSTPSFMSDMHLYVLETTLAIESSRRFGDPQSLTVKRSPSPQAETVLVLAITLSKRVRTGATQFRALFTLERS